MATPTVYWCNPKKNVCVRSPLHMFVELGESEKKNRETVEFYNKTKYSVDMADQMARQYSVKADTRRWPVAVFYNILDLAAINVFVLHKKQTGNKVSRRDFLFKLATELQYVKTTSLKDEAETLLFLDLTHYRQLLKKPKPRSVNSVKYSSYKLHSKQHQQTLFVESETKLHVASEPPRSSPNALYARERKYETFFNFVYSFCSSLQIKLFFVDRLIELRDLSICLTLKL